MATYYQQAQLSSPERAYLPTSAGLIPYNPTTANAGAGIGYGSGNTSVQYTPSSHTTVLSTGQAQHPMSQYYYSPGASQNPGIGNSIQPQYSVPQPVTGMQPASVAPMVASSGTGTGTAASAPGSVPAGTAGATLGATGGIGVNANARENAVRAAEEEAEAEAGVGSCWGCCGPPAAPGGVVEETAGGPVGPDAATAPGPPGPAGPAGERIVQYFKSGYQSAAAGTDANNGLPAAISATSPRGTVPRV